MDSIHVSENIARLRRERKLTQEQLAAFMGVTKASVSKWETRQSLPDIILLPQLAAFFDVTIDELMGYEPQLSKEQMQKIYLDLSMAFAKEPFEQVMERSRRLVRKYYSCYPFLNQIACLWVNHFMLAPTEEEQKAVLEETSLLCKRILSDCTDISLCNDIMILHAMILLQLGKPEDVIDSLEEFKKPFRLSDQGDSVLIQAYLMKGDRDKADAYTQIAMYNHLLALVGYATQYLVIHHEDVSVCEETIRRIERVAEKYEMEKLHANTIGLFYYQAAICYCGQGKKEKGLEWLRRYVTCIDHFLESPQLTLRGDRYFDNLDTLFQELELSGNAPRDRSVIFDSLLSSLSHPAFTLLDQEEEFQTIKAYLVQKRKSIGN